MTTTQQTVLHLTEYVPALFSPDEIPQVLGETLWHSYGKKGVVTVEFPTPKTGNQWQLTAQGWVGYIPIAQDFGLRLQPKLQLKNVFGMLEYAYRLKSFYFLEGLNNCESLEEFYERLAEILARRVLDRGRKGFYRTYIPKTEQVTCVRGRLDIRHTVQKPWDVKIKCHYQEQTADIEDNQILLWTLWQIARRETCTERVLSTVRCAYHALHRVVQRKPCHPQTCVKQLYHRLNEDYQPMHALCRFFLEQSGPSHEAGDRKMLPFLVNMARLYELFVAEWLKAHRVSALLPQNVDVKSQERVYLDRDKSMHFNIDLVLNDVTTGSTRYVLDTKYKTPTSPSPDDVAKIIAYAATKGCSEAVLIYPEPLQNPLNTRIHSIRVRTLTFAVDGNLEQAGQAFLQSLFFD